MLFRLLPFSLYFLLLLIVSCSNPAVEVIEAETQYLLTGADMSYTNEMEDCGVVYMIGDTVIDPYQYFADQGMGMVRLRLWHTPSWHDTLNQGRRYSDLEDVIQSMQRSKKAGMQVLLNFHLSDNWADPQRQEIPAAWQPLEHDTEMLADSLYNYIYWVMEALYQKGLVPDMVQVGNETNIEILKNISDTIEATPIDWERNAFLFRRGMKAVRDFADARHQNHIKIALHLASPSELEALIHGFVNYGVLDFDVIGLSYYWAWHHPTTIQETGAIIRKAKAMHPDKELMIFETGYVWTDQFNDEASNIISMTHPAYEPASPENQFKWLDDLSKEVAQSGGTAVLYWEPTWVSSPCYTQWGQGSHQEHATFFDFENKILENAGIGWLGRSYPILPQEPGFKLSVSKKDLLEIEWDNQNTLSNIGYVRLFDKDGRQIHSHTFDSPPATSQWSIEVPGLQAGLYFAVFGGEDLFAASRRFVVQ